MKIFSFFTLFALLTLQSSYSIASEAEERFAWQVLKNDPSPCFRFPETGCFTWTMDANLNWPENAVSEAIVQTFKSFENNECGIFVELENDEVTAYLLNTETCKQEFTKNYTLALKKFPKKLKY